MHQNTVIVGFWVVGTLLWIVSIWVIVDRLLP